jgi:hypothetical protein
MNYKPLLLSLALSSAALAGPGHDHGDAPPTASGPSLPRFAASSDLFELVGVLDGKTLTLYLDQADTNAPVLKAQIELELAGAKLAVQAQPDGSYRSELVDMPQGEALPVTATVTAGDNVDLLAAELLLPHAHLDDHEHLSAWRWGAAAAGLLALLALLGLGARSLQRRRARGFGAQA